MVNEFDKTELLRELEKRCKIAEGTASYVAETLMRLILEKFEEHGRVEFHEWFSLKLDTVPAESGTVPVKQEDGSFRNENYSVPERLKAKFHPSQAWRNYIATMRQTDLVG